MRFRSWTRLIPIMALLATVVACGEDSGPTAPAPNGPAGFEIDVPAEISVREPFDLTVRAVGAEGDLLADFAGSVALEASAGELSASSIELVGGEGSTSLIFDGALGAVTVTAQVGETRSASSAMSVVLRAVPGNAGESAAANLPLLEPVPDPADFTVDAPGLTGIPVSFRTLIVLISQSVTVADLNDDLAELGATILGGAPSVGNAPGVLVMRFPSESPNDLDTIRSSVEALPWAVKVARDAAMAPEMEPRSDGSPHAQWKWEATPQGGNWGMELIRAPQMWNLNDAVFKTGRRVQVGVIDVGFEPNHPDLTYQSRVGSDVEDHGTHVAGTIGAKWDGSGVNGLCPFADIIAVDTVSPATAPDASDVEINEAFGSMMVSLLRVLIDSIEPVRVVNMSLGYPQVLDTNSSWAMPSLASDQGELLADGLRDNPSLARAFIVVAAGNESNDGFGDLEAQYASPMANAAIEHGLEQILVVEAVSRTPNAVGGATRANFSNINGHISAPGVSVLSTQTRPALHGVKSGTSMASPHVAGLAAYALALDPDLSYSELREILLTPAKIVAGGASRRIDAFGTVLDIDRIRGNDAVMTMLADIDDGTADGNLRVHPVTGVNHTSQDADGDGGIGDGVIDMSDFRRFRDWVHYLQSTAGLTLDGGAAHAKLDIDGNGQVQAVAKEAIYPRGDFNGDGGLDPEATSFVGGTLQEGVSDLAVLRHVFHDAFYSESELPGLMQSGDVTVDATSLFAISGVTDVRTEVLKRSDGSLVEQRTLDTGATENVFTLAVDPAGYDLITSAYDDEENLKALVDQSANPKLCEDLYLKPEPEPHFDVTIFAPGTAEPGEPFSFTARVGVVYEDGTVEFGPGIAVSVNADNGIATLDDGTTNVDGFVAGSATIGGGQTSMNIHVTASGNGLDDETGTAVVTVGDPLQFFLGSGEVTVRASAAAGACGNQVYDDDGDEVPFTDFGSASLAAAAGQTDAGQCDGTTDSSSGVASSSIQAEVSFDESTGRITVTGNGGCSVDGEASGTHVSTYGRGYTSAQFYLPFFLETEDDFKAPAGYRFRLQATVNASATGESTRGSASVILRGEGMTWNAAASILVGASNDTPTETIDETGVLGPGSYTIQVTTTSSGTARGYGPGTIGGSGDFVFELTLEPEGGGSEEGQIRGAPR